MEFEKITKSRKTERKRWYDDACGTAFALELIGERWAILIMRELMFGPRRFGELRRDLPGLSANILTQRLNQLEQNRILRKRKLPPPASVQVYELTEWGAEAEQLVQMLGRWATRHPGHDPSLPLSAASIMMSFRTMFAPERAGEMDARIGFRLGSDAFVVHIHDGILDTARTEPEDVDLLFEGTPPGLAAAVYGGEKLPDLEQTGILSVSGDRQLADRFITLFPLPEKLPDCGQDK
ncbi:helix-turn-helix domain-containing protein [Sphingorhabdus sp. YGSMI21]|uniref:winged helix-turn-helix transcriptional regulator n=1 Tax=Sphingorhabdus sp. YGSMI21 TaxID=2077182 RepID=UPI000C1E909F|nr:helix-turn-helix domain-containing protein [Sphingorhabdus sp. YGSMI21]ATW04401.1 transcriptional regulator [Sphingorhabdus sp. YGSMI21]